MEEIGSKFKLTRERVRQIVEKAVPKIRKEGGPALYAQLSGVAVTCHEMVCPLTPEMLGQWLTQSPNEHRFPFAFYVRLLAELSAKIPGWPKGQEPSASQTVRANNILMALQSGLEERGLTLPLKAAYQTTLSNTKLRSLTVGEFLETIKHSKLVVIQFLQPDQPQVQLRHVRIIAVAKSILKTSDQPLTPEEILSRGQSRFGRELIDWDPRTLGNALVPDKGFYLLGPRAYGLRQHFKLTEAAWHKVRTDTKNFLSYIASLGCSSRLALVE